MGACNGVQPKVVDSGPSANGGCGCMHDSCCCIGIFYFVLLYFICLIWVNVINSEKRQKDRKLYAKLC